MTPERWQQINTLLDAVLEQPPEARRAYLDGRCRDDQELRREVLSLLDAHDQANSFLEKPAKAYAAPLIPMSDTVSNDAFMGREIDGYRLLEVIGRGGMGVVYKALDINLDKVVALKMIDPALARDESFVRRFRAEARALARIDSPHIVRVHAMRQTDAGLFIVMEYVDGGTVTDLLQDGPVPWQKTLPVVRQMLTALEHAHSVGVIHRDIKPSNIMLTKEGMVKVTDFGLAKIRQPDQVATVTQGISGTLFYMSPEQVEGAVDLDHRTDLYSMGMTIYQMLAGRLPLDRDEGNFAVMRAIVEERFKPPSAFKADVPAPVDAAVMKALEKLPARRYQSAAEMRAAFEALRTASPGDDTLVTERLPHPEPGPDYRRLLRVAGGVLGVALLALAGYLLWPRPALLSVQTTPDQAIVTLDGREVGRSPLEDFRVGAGSLTLHLEKAGYEPVETTRVAVAGEPLLLHVSLRPLAPPDTTSPPATLATLRITSTPGNAVVYINDEEKGTTDASGVLEVAGVGPGTVSVEIRRAGYEDWTSIYTAVAGQTVTVDAPLEREEGGPGPDPPPATASLTVRVQGPSGAVSVDGERCGTRCSVSVGTREVACTANGQTETKRVTFTANQPQTLTCYTERTLVVQVRWESDNDSRDFPWATIFIDGEEENKLSDLKVTRGVGRHTVEVSRVGFDVLTPPRRVEIRPAFEPPTEETLVFRIRNQ